MFYRLLNRQIEQKKGEPLHYFPKNQLSMNYQYHKLLIEALKEQLVTCQMDPTEVVKTAQLPIKDEVKKQTTLITFNCSDAGLLAAHSFFYSELLECLLGSETRSLKKTQ
jgi:hypothetical protein